MLEARGTGYTALYLENSLSLNSLFIDAKGLAAGAPQLLHSDPEAILSPTAASLEAATLVAWSGYGAMGAVVLSPTGQPNATVGFPQGFAVGEPGSIAAGANQFAVGFRTIALSSGAREDVAVEIVAADGTVIGEPVEIWGFVCSQASGFSAAFERPSVAWTGSDYRVAWFESAAIGDGGYAFSFMGSRVSGTAADPVTSNVIDASLEPLGAPVWDGSGYGALALLAGGGGQSLAFFHMDATGAPTDFPIVLASAADAASLIWTGREYAAAWSDSAQVQFARIGNCP